MAKTPVPTFDMPVEFCNIHVLPFQLSDGQRRMQMISIDSIHLAFSVALNDNKIGRFSGFDGIDLDQSR